MQSCDIYFYRAGMALGPDKIAEMAHLFGLGSRSGIDLPSENPGTVPDRNWKMKRMHQPWYPGDEVNLAIGQGALLITPLQLANAYSTFLGGGTLRTPVLLVGQPATARGTLPLTPAEAAHLKLGLELVTGPAGTANTVFALAGYTDFLGKSGTAEDAGLQQHVLFVAGSPQAKPTAVCAVVLDSGVYGSVEAGPIARDIVLAALKAEGG